MVITVLSSCDFFNQSKNNQETIVQGKTSIIVDETIQPIIEDEVAVFESYYPSEIKIKSQSEKEVINALLKGDFKIAVLSRKLTPKEELIFKRKKIIPRTVSFAKDALVFIVNKNSSDSVIHLSDIKDILEDMPSNRIKGLVFDNFNSSTLRYLKEKLGVQHHKISSNMYSFSSSEEVVKYISENQGMVGVVGLNWLVQPPNHIKSQMNNVKVLSVHNIKPTQNTIISGQYSFIRDLYIIDCQGFSGLGQGLSSFVMGEIGQRIVLKSGLMPIAIPTRNIIVRDGIKKP